MDPSEYRGPVQLDGFTRSLRSLRSYAPFVALSAIVLPASAEAETFTFDFTSRAYFDSSSTGLWDSHHGRLGPKVAPGGTAGKEIDFGDGRHGVFSDGASHSGISVSGSTITINSTYTYQFTSFHLSSGKTLNVTGSQPLKILVLGSVNIAGQIAANGQPGQARTAYNSGLTAQGGAGGAGGGTGGNGALENSVPGSATDGTPISASFSGGLKGANDATPNEPFGGGGGCSGKDTNASDAEPGYNFGSTPGGNAGACTQTRATVAAAFETSFLGGAGGGGGGALQDGADQYKGAAGGGGGGAIRFSSLGDVAVTGTISVSGGAGGNSPTGSEGAFVTGAGGGGSGGTIWIQSLGSISGAGGTLNLLGGTGGISEFNETDGGKGSVGVYRADSAGGTQSIATVTTGSLAPVSTVSSVNGSYDVVSSGISLTGSGYYDFDTPTETFADCGAVGTSGTSTIVYEGSADGVTFENAVSAANINDLRDYPYVRFKATFSGADPDCLTGLAIPYTPRELSNLTLKGGLACGNMSQLGKGKPGNSTSPQHLSGDATLFTMAGVFAYLMRRRRPRTVH